MAAADGLSSEARVSMAGPRRYLGQLCKHFGHKVRATYDEQYRRGRMVFPEVGVCTLEADESDSLLVMYAKAENEAALARLEDVLGRHLKRFAFREPVTVMWTRSS
jgi:hypothetical protein